MALSADDSNANCALKTLLEHCRFNAFCVVSNNMRDASVLTRLLQQLSEDEAPESPDR